MANQTSQAAHFPEEVLLYFKSFGFEYRHDKLPGLSTFVNPKTGKPVPCGIARYVERCLNAGKLPSDWFLGKYIAGSESIKSSSLPVDPLSEEVFLNWYSRMTKRVESV